MVEYVAALLRDPRRLVSLVNGHQLHWVGLILLLRAPLMLYIHIQSLEYKTNVNFRFLSWKASQARHACFVMIWKLLREQITQFSNGGGKAAVAN